MIYWVMFFAMIVLTIVALVHLFWAFGGKWPGKDDASLAKAVVGTNGVTTMPPRWMTFVVAILIVLAALWPFGWLHWKETPLPKWMWSLGMIGLTFIFVARGIASYVPVFRAQAGEQPFARYDQMFYAPLCLVLGGAFAIMLFMKGF